MVRQRQGIEEPCEIQGLCRNGLARNSSLLDNPEQESMKKEYAIVYFLVGLVGVIFILTRLFPHVTLADLVTSSQIISQKQTSRVTVSIDFGTTAKTYRDIDASTAFDALKESVKRDNITLSGKQYDFGYLVERIGDKTNTKEKSWLYFVNGTAGDVASDKKILNPGDRVEWKYVKPS